MILQLRHRLAGERGQSSLEYVAMVSVLVFVVVTGLSALNINPTRIACEQLIEVLGDNASCT